MAEIILNVSGIAKSSMSLVTADFTAAIDAMLERVRETAQLEEQATVLETKLEDLKALSERGFIDEARQLEAQKAEMEKQTSHLEFLRQELELRRARLDLQVASFETRKKLIDEALESASKIVDRLYPSIETETRGKLVGTLLSSLLQVGQGKELEIALPSPFDVVEGEKATAENVEPGGIVELEATKPQITSSPLSAIARVHIEDGNKVLVGKDYVVEAGITWKQLADAQKEASESSLEHPAKPVTFDIMLFASEQLEITERQMRLCSEPLKSTPQMVEFHFRPVSQGHCSLAIDFYYKLHWLRTIQLEFDAVA